MSELTVPEPSSAILMYQTEDGGTRIGARLAEGTVWLTQAVMAELFQTTPQNVTMDNISRADPLDGGASSALSATICKDITLEDERAGRLVSFCS